VRKAGTMLLFTILPTMHVQAQAYLVTEKPETPERKLKGTQAWHATFPI